ncbi:MAG: hypothetical protein HC888_04830 [Candidatus Competibacteraceae bacterium]|nr:hypothetical protein [Candidatus Competibacteraceae bacterium]
MKVKREEESIEITPESDFEIECLKLLARKVIQKKNFVDDWHQTGPFRITFAPDWD